MVRRYDSFGTQLCENHQRGRCQRSSCSFAHGQAELRPVPKPSSGPRRSRSPSRRARSKSPINRTPPSRRTSWSRSRSPTKRMSPSRRTPSSRPRSPIKRIEQGHLENYSSRRERTDSQGPAKDKYNRRKENSSFSDENDALRNKIEALNLENKKLQNHNYEQKNSLAEQASIIEDLKLQLQRAHEDFKRSAKKCRKCLRACGCYLVEQGEELERSKTRLQSLHSKILKLASDDNVSAVSELYDSPPTKRTKHACSDTNDEAISDDAYEEAFRSLVTEFKTANEKNREGAKVD